MMIIYSSPGFILQVMLESSVYLALSVYCCCCLLAAVASCALPIETTGRGLQESSHREWGQEMVGRASTHGSGRIPQSSPGSQGWGHAGWSASEGGDRGEEKRQGEAKKKKARPAFCVHLQSHPMTLQFRHHSGFKEPGSTILYIIII